MAHFLKKTHGAPWRPEGFWEQYRAPGKSSLELAHTHSLNKKTTFILMDCSAYCVGLTLFYLSVPWVCQTGLADVTY